MHQNRSLMQSADRLWCEVLKRHGDDILQDSPVLELKDFGNCYPVGYLIDLGFGGAVGDTATSDNNSLAPEKISRRSKIGTGVVHAVVDHLAL